MSAPNPPSPRTAPPAAYLRQPTIAGDTIVFVADDDLWRVDATGGAALRLTAGLSEPATPCLSADGRWLAFAGRDEQHTEVWLMGSEGGPAQLAHQKSSFALPSPMGISTAL